MKNPEINVSKSLTELLFPKKIGQLVAVYSRRQDGNMSLSYGDTTRSLDNRKLFLSNLGIDYRNLVCAKQIHSANIYAVSKIDAGKGALTYDAAIPDTDSLITDQPDLPLAVLTADCLPVFLYDPLTPAVGIVHAGWRSAKEKIVLKTIQMMQKRFNTQAAHLQAAFGPAIDKCCCEVEEEFSGFFPGRVGEREKRLYLDLLGVNVEQLLSAGVKKENITDSAECTFCQDKDYFSFRKEGAASGRMLSVIMLKG